MFMTSGDRAVNGNQSHPFESVRVEFPRDYRTACHDFGGGWRTEDAWLALGALLVHRPGWHFEVQGGGPLWSLGVLGESRVNIHVTDQGRIHCHDHDLDSDAEFDDVAAVDAWLDGREDRARQPSPVLLEMSRSFNWKVLADTEYALAVTWSDGYFCATLPGLAEPAFGTTLPEVVDRARQMLCAVVGAPAELAPRLTLRAELDATVTRILTAAS